MTSGMQVGLLSLDDWDDVWRRNQHLAAGLVRSGAVTQLRFLTPPRHGLAVRASSTTPLPGIEVVTTPLVVPRRYGGHHLIGAWLRQRLWQGALLWGKEPTRGARA